jgi:hypothetical protein
MKKITVFAVIMIMVMALTGCSKKGPVAIVNGVEISREDFNTELKFELAAYETQGVTLTDEQIKEVKQYIVDRLINTQLLKEAAAKAGITAASLDVDGEFAAVKESFEDEATFEKALAEADFTLESYKAALTDVLMIEALFEQELELSKLEISEKEIQAMVDIYLENYEGEEEIDEEDLREYLTYTLKEKKAESMRGEYVEKLRKESEIKYLDF